MTPFRLPWDDTFFKVCSIRQKFIASLIAKHTGCIVQDGPFKGMHYSTDQSWGSGDITAKLLGFYEEEIYPLVQAWPLKQYDMAIDIGCAEGFYAIGMALLMPDATILAHDLDDKALEIVGKLAVLNNVQDRVKTGGEITCDNLQAILGQYSNPLVFCDSEGFERTILDPVAVPNLLQCDILVECHDFVAPDISDLLIARFQDTHDVYKIDEQGRNPNRSDYLRHLSAHDKMIAVCEFRPEQMHWLWIERKQAPDKTT